MVYGNDVTFVFDDYDPSHTTYITGNPNFPGSANYYDPVSKAAINITFRIYDNCNGTANGVESANTENIADPSSAPIKER